jgi:RND family efflux transporter MFP subunit
MKKILALLVVLAVGGAVGYWQWQLRSGAKTTFTFAEVKKGRLEATVGSTGTLQPREVVDVGAQVLGRIIYLGKATDTKSGIVDWGAQVKGPKLGAKGEVITPGMTLAQIDPTLYEAQRNSARASVKAAKADVLVKSATLYQASRDWGRVEKLHKSGSAMQAEHDQIKAAYDAANASLELSKANVGLAEANLKNAQTNLDYCTITAPVDGVVIDRRVNVGQTVVASLSAPSLFLIARDLSQMEVWATVNEVDVGKIHAGQKVRFTVDAFPGKVHEGEVVPQGKLPFRLNATMNQNVVTYTVVVSVDNAKVTLRESTLSELRAEKVPDDVIQKLRDLKDREFQTQKEFLAALGKTGALEGLRGKDDRERFQNAVLAHSDKDVGMLRPYLTANLTFVVADKKDALLVPNAALRWQPARDQIAPDTRDAYYKTKGKKRSPTDTEASNRGIVWTQGDDGYVRYVEVQTGLSDSVNTEILGVVGGGEFPEHTKVIVGEAVASSRSSGANPFVASPFKKKE